MPGLNIIGRPWEVSDFTVPALAEAWTSYQDAIKLLDARKATFSVPAQTYCNHLIDSHKEKCKVLEQAQRIINHRASFQGESVRQNAEVML